MDSGMVAMKMMSSEQQQQQQQLCFKTMSFNNGKRQHTHEMTSSLYMECQKNHAAATGGHALDGCGEFMPPPPPSLNCAACGCHRNFHRLETPSAAAGMKMTNARAIDASPIFIHRPQRFSSASPSNSSSPSRSEAPISSIYPSAPQILMTLSSGVEISPQITTPTTATTTQLCFDEAGKPRKRFRTKFSAEQKDKMRRFAEVYGWKMQRSDDEAVKKLCDEIGVCRSVLKVWIHNNKSRNTMGITENINFDYNDGGSREQTEIHVAGNNGEKQSIDGGQTTSSV